MDVSIIIVNYNTKNLTANCIDSIFALTYEVSFEIILVDNASTDGSIDFFNKDQRIKFIKNSKNIGFGQANNKGLKFASGKYILFLNSDTLLINNAIKLLANFLDSNKDVGIVGGNLFDSDMHPTHSYRKIFPNAMWEINELFARLPERLCDKNWQFNHSSSPLSVSYITGADLMIRKTIVEKIGAFESQFFMYYEDAELCYRVRKSGYKIISYPQAKIQHLVGKSLEMSDKKLELVYRGQNTFRRLSLSGLHYKICRLLSFITIISRIFIYQLTSDERSHIWKTNYKLFLFDKYTN